eukprot:CAMPEP_0174733210 /NCGR_PEP_ID=MMETSP1094-20130205/60871_1 /TAXON_ID=156173 /ORGANISM="Chrysochromulina brevifilum, Strain UTEX LB 985" /LENGTH=110 /DNA_ID=CAMNT_0015935835 /DNA_START=12 /DNA_END=341 /DNA_ORIENTATION=+
MRSAEIILTFLLVSCSVGSASMRRSLSQAEHPLLSLRGGAVTLAATASTLEEGTPASVLVEPVAAEEETPAPERASSMLTVQSATAALAFVSMAGGFIAGGSLAAENIKW